MTQFHSRTHTNNQEIDRIDEVRLFSSLTALNFSAISSVACSDSINDEQSPVTELLKISQPLEPDFLPLENSDSKSCFNSYIFKLRDSGPLSVLSDTTVTSIGAPQDKIVAGMVGC